MHNRSVLPSVPLSLVVALLCAKVLSADASPNVPLHHESYTYIEKLVAFGLIDSALLGTKPFTRQEMARLIAEAKENQALQRGRTEEFADVLLGRLQREFRDELIRRGTVRGHAPRVFLKPLDYAQLRYVYAQGSPSNSSFTGKRGSSIITDGTPLAENNQGITYLQGSTAGLEFFSHGQVGDRLAVAYRGLVELEDLDGAPDEDVSTLHGYVVMSPFTYVDIEIGRDTLWWGQGERGTLVLTDNAPAFDLLKVSNGEPFLLPGVFRRLGPVKYAAFITRLESGRAGVSEPYLFGTRFNFKPTPNFEMGVSRTMMFGGEGNGISFRRFLELQAGVDIDPAQQRGTLDKTNQISGIDGRLRIPTLRNSEFYFEIGGESLSGGTPPLVVPTRNAFIGGIYVPRLTADGRTDLRVEYANTHNTSSRGPFWYNHAVFRSGYTFERRIIGHPVGGEAEELWGRVRRYVTDAAVVALDVAYQDRDLAGPTGEEHFQLGLGASYRFREDWSVSLDYRGERVQDRSSKNTQDNHLVVLNLTKRF